MFIRFLRALFSTHDRATGDLPAVQDFQLDRYLGKWYEIARLPHWFEVGNA